MYRMTYLKLCATAATVLVVCDWWASANSGRSLLPAHGTALALVLVMLLWDIVIHVTTRDRIAQAEARLIARVADLEDSLADAIGAAITDAYLAGVEQNVRPTPARPAPSPHPGPRPTHLREIR